jgi:hypothetical protein
MLFGVGTDGLRQFNGYWSTSGNCAEEFWFPHVCTSTWQGPIAFTTIDTVATVISTIKLIAAAVCTFPLNFIFNYPTKFGYLISRPSSARVRIENANENWNVVKLTTNNKAMRDGTASPQVSYLSQSKVE